MSKAQRGRKMPQGWWGRHKGKVKAGIAGIVAVAALLDGADAVWDDVSGGDDSSIVCSDELRNFGNLHKDFPDAEIPVPDDVEEKCDISTFLDVDEGDEDQGEQSEPDEQEPAPAEPSP